MAKNSYAIEKALRGGLRAVNREVPEMADEVLEQFKNVVSESSRSDSLPGSPPHLDSGAYRAGLAAKTSRDKITIYASGGQNNKAVWLEFGTRNMEARPHWRTRLPIIAAKVVPEGVGAAFIRGEIT